MAELSSTPPVIQPSVPAGAPNGIGKVSVALVVIAIVSFAVMSGLTLSNGWLTPIRPKEASKVFSFSGDGNSTQSPTFTVQDGWEVRWKHQGTLQQIVWTDEYGQSDYVIAMHRKPIRPDGGVNIAKGGVYSVQVLGEGPWTVNVYQFSRQ